MYKVKNKRNFKYKTYKGVKFKSTYEAQVAQTLDSQGIKWEYEPEKFTYQPPLAVYSPDFKVTYPDGRVEYIEVKGYFDPQARTKMQMIKQQYPDLPIVLHFMKEYTRISPKSPMTYLDWADKNKYPVRHFNEYGTWLEGDEEVTDYVAK